MSERLLGSVAFEIIPLKGIEDKARFLPSECQCHGDCLASKRE